MYDLILWKNRRTEKANTYAVTQNPDKTITLTPVPGEIIEPGTGFNQQNMNHMDNGINEADYCKYGDRAVITAPKRIRKYLFRGWIGGSKEQRNIPI